MPSTDQKSLGAVITDLNHAIFKTAVPCKVNAPKTKLIQQNSSNRCVQAISNDVENCEFEKWTQILNSKANNSGFA